MKQILAMLAENNITEPPQVRAVAMMMLDAVYDSSIFKEANDLAVMSDLQITHAIQQIQGGQ